MKQTSQAGLVSIIMPCHNAAQYLASTISCVLAQTYRNWELIVVDDGSTDDSTDIVCSFVDPRIKLNKQDNQGVTAARNRGLQEVSGEYIAFLDADDHWEANFLELMIAALSENPTSALAYCGWQNRGLPGPQGKPYVPSDYETPDKLSLLLESCRWPIHAALTRAEVIREAGGFDTRFQTSEDYWLWLKVVSHYPIVRVPHVLAYYNFHNSQRSQKEKGAHQAIKALNHRKLVVTFLNEHKDICNTLSREQVLKFTDGELLRRGYLCYWKRDLHSARKIFRAVMSHGYGSLSDWKYMLPSLLPLPLHKAIIRWKDRTK